MPTDPVAQAAAAGRTSETRFRQVWETTSDAMALSDAEGIILAANPAYLTLYGYTATQVLGQSFALIFPETERAWALAEYQRVFASEAVTMTFESVIRRADGAVRIVEACATFLSEAGQRTAMLSTIHDITARKQAEQRLQVLYQVSAAVNRAAALEPIYEAALTALGEVLHVDRAAILLFDAESVMRFTAWRGLSVAYRQQAEGYTPWPPGELNPQPVLLPNVAQAALAPLQTRSLAEGIRALAFIPLRAEGRLLGKFMLAYDQPYAFPAAEVQWAQAIGEHVAHALQRQQADAQLRQLNATLEQRVTARTQELERSNRELKQFADVVAHDLKAPLRALDQLVQWISSEAQAVLPAAAQTHLTQLRARVQRMNALLTELRAYARAGRQQHAPERVDTAKLVRHLIDLLGLPPGFTIRAEVALPPLVTERVPLETVLRNLLDNAVKHHHQPSAGHVQITAQALGEWIEFQVADDGPGIDPQFHARIFQPFQTVKPRTEGDDSGMGLALVKKIIESRGGTIAVESQLGHGATFRFTWPHITKAETGR